MLDLLKSNERKSSLLDDDIFIDEYVLRTPAVITDLTRYKNFKRVDYVFKCPKDKVNAILETISANFGIDTPVRRSFKNMNDAKEFFCAQSYISPQ